MNVNVEKCGENGYKYPNDWEEWIEGKYEMIEGKRIISRDAWEEMKRIYFPTITLGDFGKIWKEWNKKLDKRGKA